MPANIRASLAAATVLTAALSGFGPLPAASAADSEPPNYVALGDSYSAGVFVRPWDASDGCGRSARNYPHQVAAALGLNLLDVTCGAAEVQDGILGPQPSKKLLGPPSVPPQGEWPEKSPQINSLTSSTDYVSVGIGGNTLGFGEIVTQCLTRGRDTLGIGTPCTKYFTEGAGRDWLAGKFAQLNREYGEMMTGIRSKAPDARVLVVGYPAIVPTSSGCTWGAFKQLGTVAKGDMPWLDGVERQLNEVVKDNAVEHGATYVDTYESSVDHGVCAAAEQRWMYGVRSDLTGEGNQTDPPSTLCSQIPGDGEACTFVHPNASGLDNQARQVRSAFESLGATAPATRQP